MFSAIPFIEIKIIDIMTRLDININEKSVTKRIIEYQHVVGVAGMGSYLQIMHYTIFFEG